MKFYCYSSLLQLSTDSNLSKSLLRNTHDFTFSLDLRKIDTTFKNLEIFFKTQVLTVSLYIVI